MKHFYIILFFIFTNTNIKAQTCPSGDITFTSQVQIDNFTTNFPGCEEIDGDVTIEESVSGNITNLAGLSPLTLIAGDFIVNMNSTLVDFSGLENLESIEGDIEITENGALVNFVGLDNVEVIEGDVTIINNSSLTTIMGLESLVAFDGDVIIQDNNSLGNLLGFGGIVNAYGDIEVSMNSMLNSLSGLNNMTTISGGLILNDNNVLASLAQLSNLSSVGGNVIIQECHGLSNLSGLEALTSIGGFIRISENNTLTSLAGIQNIDPSTISSSSTIAEDIEIFDNPLLTDCMVSSICDALLLSGTTTDIHTNGSGCSSESEVSDACTPLACTSLIHPQNGSVNQKVNTNLYWQFVPDADEYKIVAGSSSGSTNYLDSISVGNQNYIDPNFIFDYNSDVYVKVIPYKNGVAAIGCAEESFKTTIPCAIMSYPLHNSTNIAIYDSISWNAVPNAIGYKIKLSSYPGGEDILAETNVGTVTKYIPEVSFNYGTTVYVFITAFSADGDAQNCGEKKFTTTALPGAECIVTNTNDFGIGSLRHAVVCANINPGPDTITFAISGIEPDTINVRSPYPNITGDSTIIDGTTEPGNFPMDRKIVIDQSLYDVYNNKVFIVQGKYSQIYGLDFQNSNNLNNQVAIVYAFGSDHFKLGGKMKGNYFSKRYSFTVSTGSNVNWGTIEGNTFDGTEGIMKNGILLSSGTNRVTIGGDSTWQQNNFLNCYSDAVRFLNYANNNKIKNNYFKHNHRAIYNKGNHLGGLNWGGEFIGNTFVCNDTAIVNTPSANYDILPPIIDIAKVNYITGTANPGSIVEVYMTADTCVSTVSFCGGELSIGQDTCGADGKFSIILDAANILSLGDKVSAIQTDTLLKGSSIFSACVAVNSTCVDYVYVDYDNTIGSLRSAIACATNGDTINFLSHLTGKNIMMDNSILIDKNLTVIGLGNPETTILSSSSTYTFQIASGKQVEIKDLSLCINNNSATNIIENIGMTTLSNVTIIDKRTGQPLNTIINQTGSTLTFNEMVKILQN